MSSRILTEDEIDVLGLGFSFAITPRKNCGIDILSSCHDFINDLPSADRSPSLIGVLYEGFMKSVRSENNIPSRFVKALSSLKRDSSIIVTKADKGGKIVIMDRVDYNTKMENLLNDPNTYLQLRSNPLSRIQSTFNSRLKEITKDVIFDCKRFIRRLPSLPYMYGLPKIHKPNVPLRPIISNRGAPSYHLAKWLASILTPFLGSFSESHVINNLDFIRKLNNLTNCDGKMISYDVVSLFTNVDLNCTLDF